MAKIVKKFIKDGIEYDAIYSGLPSGGTEGQILTKTATGETWADNNYTRTFNIPSQGDDISEQIAILNNGGNISYRKDNYGAEDWHFNVVAFIKDERTIEVRSDMVVPFDESKPGLGKKDLSYVIYIKYGAGGIVSSVEEVYAGGIPTGGTEGQVLTKTETGVDWKDSEGGMKVFTLANTSDLTTATQAYNYLKSGGMCMIQITSPNVGFISKGYYTLNSWSSSYVRFYSSLSESDKIRNNYYVLFTVSSDSVTSISMYMNTSEITTSLPTYPNAKTLYFITA